MSVRSQVETIFGPEGTLSKVVSPFEWREQQARMARAVADALHRSEKLIVEAPTGVGKSLAYLIPGALWAKAEKRVFLVSTHTKNLQDQILRRDFPLLARLTDRKIDAAVLKGRANYLCLRRWQRARDELLGSTDGEAFVRAMEVWVQLTESGDLEEGPPLSPRLRPLLERIGSEARFCSSDLCDADAGCYYKLSRRRAREAQVVLVNHSLLVLEVLEGRAGLPPFDALVVDEAHHLPRIAAEALARRTSMRGWRDAWTGFGGQGEPGLTDRIRRIIRMIPGQAERQTWQRRLRDAEGEVRDLIGTSGAFFAGLQAIEGFPRQGGRARYRLGAGSGGAFPENTYAMLEEAGRVIQRFEALVNDLDEALGKAEEMETLRPEIELTLDGGREALRAATFLVEADDPGTVYWFENEAGDGPTLRSRPVDMADTLGDRLRAGGPLVLTSATLATDGSVDFFARQTGLAGLAREMVLPPVFPLAEQVRILVPRQAREPQQDGYEEDLARGILGLSVSVPRKLLVLFTSHDTLKRVEERLRDPLEDRGIHLYAQGRDVSRHVLAQSFTQSDRGVLLGAASFWEGVDFPGEHLEILVMARLPFPVPTDPFVEAYAERLRESGADPFESFMIPEAIGRFRQGFGRLIRRRDDRGVFVVLDPRIVRRGYGQRFTDALGLPVKAIDTWEELVGAAQAWFAGRP